MLSLEAVLAAATTTGDYVVLKALGVGGEGAVYLIRDNATRDRFVVKRFHEPRPSTGPVGLPIYARATIPSGLGLPNIRLLMHDDQIQGLSYPWIPLTPIHPRVMAASERMRQSVVGAFCRMQSYLISQLRIGLWDVTADHFLLDWHGTWHYIDFGWGVSPLDHPRFLDQGYFGYAFAMLLLSLFGVQIRLILMPSSEYLYDRPCAYWMLKEFDVLARDHAWVRALVSEVRDEPASVFLAPELYQRVSRDAPDHAALPWAAILASVLLRRASLLRKAGKAL